MELTELKKHMKGVQVVQTTPFNADGSVDLEGMRLNTRWLAERVAGKDFFITPLGSAGEFASMSSEEGEAVIKAVVEEVNGRAVVMPGAARVGTLETIKMVQRAQSAGADGAMIVLPYYLVPEEEGMYLHYKQIAESVDSNFGIMVYNNPDVSGSWIKPALMKRLSKIPNIIAVKEMTLDIFEHYAMQRALDPEDMAIIHGMGEIAFLFLALHGCPGFTAYIPNFAPELSYSVYEAATTRDFDKLTQLVNSCFLLDSFLERVEKNHGPDTGIPSNRFAGNMDLGMVKEAMDIVGLRGGEVRLPLLGLNKEEKAELRDVLKAMKVI